MRTSTRRTAPGRTGTVTRASADGPIFTPMSSSLRELKLWQESVGLAGDVIRAARSARREVKAFAERLMTAACAVAEAVADAHGRYDPRDQQRAYRTARCNLLILETSLAIARQADILSAPLAAQLGTRAGNVSRLLSGYLAFLERQIAAEEASRSPIPAKPSPSGERSFAVASLAGSQGVTADAPIAAADP